MGTKRMLLSADDLMDISASASDGRKYELVEGELIETPPAGAPHGRSAMRLGGRLGRYVEEHALGVAFAAETGFRLSSEPDTVLAPDAAFVSTERLPPGGELPEGFMDLAPDLVVEVVSPSDTAVQVQEKVDLWLRAGVRLIWVVFPKTRKVTVYQSDEIRMLSEADQLSGAPVLPGFSCPVADIF